MGTDIHVCLLYTSDFDAIPITNEVKPRVGIVGEILVKFAPAANNYLVDLLESCLLYTSLPGHSPPGAEGSTTNPVRSENPECHDIQGAAGTHGSSSHERDVYKRQEQYRLDDASFDFSIRLIPEKA